MAMRTRDEEVMVFPNAAGIDVGASSHWVAVPRHATGDPVREFGAVTDDLNAMADWLLACGVDTVALESTGVYWIPVYEVLEQRGLKVWLVDARQMKYVPGRKSDIQDCQWLQKLMSLGFLRRRAFICRNRRSAGRARWGDAADKRRWTKPPLVRWRAGLLGNVSFRRRWRGRCEGSAGRCVSLHEGWLAHERAWWPIDVCAQVRAGGVVAGLGAISSTVGLATTDIGDGR
jgi:hypothetical protein